MWINPVTQETSEEPLDGYETVLPTQPPLTGRLEKAAPGTPEQIDGMWQQTWRIEPLTDAEVAQVIEAERVNAGNPLTSAIALNNAAYEAAIASLTTGYPPSEIATWERQRAEAMAWHLDDTSPTPWIDIAAQARGIPRAEYLARTYAKAAQFAQASAYLTGLRQRYETEIKAAADPSSVLLEYSL